MRKVIRLSEGVKVEIYSFCPFCGEGPLNGARGVDVGPEEKVYSATGGKYDPNADPPPMQPCPGCMTACGTCGGLMTYHANPGGILVLKQATEDEIACLKTSEQWPVLEVMIKDIKSRYRHVQFHGDLG